MNRTCLFVGVALFANVAVAQTSELYMADYYNTNCYVVQGGAIVRTIQRSGNFDGPGLVVQSTVKMYGQSTNNTGLEYDYNGNTLTGSYTNPGFIDCYDGATDGTTRNWTISHNDFSNNFACLVGDQNWGGVAIAFVPQRRSSGVTYDATDDTLWIANNVGGCDRVQHYSTSGTLLGEFTPNPALASGGGYGIALDPADGTLWIPGAFGSFGSIYQYDKAGNELAVLAIPGLLTNAMSAEFRIGGGGSGITSYCTAGTTLNNCLASISGAGTSSISAANLVVNVNNVEGQKQGIIFYGNLFGIASPWGSSSSLLCVKAPLQRTGVQNSGGTLNACNGTLTLNFFSYLSAHPSALGNPFSAGQKAFFQGWFRDQGSSKTTSLSNALQVTFTP
jgi:hypothetical protein